MQPYPLARLDKNDRRVWCSRRGCHCQIARVVGRATIPAWSAAARHSGQRPDYRYLEIRPGFVLAADGIWRLSKHATERLCLGPEPSYRREPKIARGERLAEVAAEHDSVIATTEQVVTDFPALVQCPLCRLIQTLDADALRLTPIAQIPGTRLYVPLR